MKIRIEKWLILDHSGLLLLLPVIRIGHDTLFLVAFWFIDAVATFSLHSLVLVMCCAL